MSASTIKAETLYLVRNKIRADILLPYSSLDENPKAVLWSGQCMIADKGLVQALEGWLEIIDIISTPCEASFATVETKAVEVEPEEAIDALLQYCCQVGQGKFLKVWQITEVASREARTLLNGFNPENRKARVAVGRLLRKLAGNNPPGWTVSSRERSHTVEYRILPNNL